MKNLLSSKIAYPVVFFFIIMAGVFLPQTATSQVVETPSGQTQKDSLSPPAKSSLFDHIYRMEGRPQIKIGTNVNSLIGKKMKEDYQESSFQLFDGNGKECLDINGRIRSRGNIRKQVSYFPPVKFDFKKTELDSLGFLKLDKLKFVFPTDSKRQSQKRLYKEFFLYELYGLLDSKVIRAKLVDVSLIHKGKEKYYFTGFLIEEEADYARRNDAIIVEKGKLRASALDRESFLKMVFFQYMIANTDYAVSNKHNLEIVKFPSVDRVVAMPYDFDYSGFVGQQYAVPNERFPIHNIHERYLFPGYRITEKEYRRMVEYFLSIEQEVYDLCETATYMDERVIKENKYYLKTFFKLLRKPKRLKHDLVKNNS